jgi:lipoate-protein ligase B
MKQAWLIDLGMRDYKVTWELQLDLVAKRASNEIPDTLLLVEHPHVYTLGRRCRNRPKEIRVENRIVPCYAIERGGDITYHGPGQLVGYPVFDLNQRDRDLHRYLRNLEESLMRACADFGIGTERRAGFTGVWTRESVSRKIASIGIAVRNWVTYHGFALNVNPDLKYFQTIHPCGLDGGAMTSLEAMLGRPVPMKSVKESLVQHLSAQFALDWTSGTELQKIS